MSTFAPPIRDQSQQPAKWFVSGDWDGFFGLFFSGFPDLLLIAGLTPLCGFPADLVATRILPAVAISIFGGNLFYAWQAHKLATETGRSDVTAIPFGVNTPTIFAYIFLIMLPVYQRTHDGQLAWQVGVCACFLSGIVQTAGAFCTDWLRRHTPTAALLCPLAGIAISFLCMGFILRIFQMPALALVPTVIILTVYSSRIRLPFRLPGGLLCIAAGVAALAVLKLLHYPLPPAPPSIPLGFHLPQPINLIDFVRHGEGWKYLSIILPMSALDTIVSLQILESVKIAGDDYRTMPSLLVNGLATLAAAAFGSPFPTTLYFGHLAHKANGARIGYSILSGASNNMLICVTGLISPIQRWVPLEVVAIVIVWFGLVMVAQAFQEVPKSHCIAVAFGLLPMLASWALELVDLALSKAGSSLFEAAPKFGDELAIYGLIALSQGSLLASMIWAAAIAFMLDRRLLHSAAWIFAGAILCFFGFMHAYTLTPRGVENRIGLFVSPAFAVSYVLAALFLVLSHLYVRHRGPDAFR
jgi:AGZA family xanthine/uracil permease-like MFS transporter